ncbi:hypothetical protein GCM10011529_30600 [Polymorphobacter glacialis]|uniref:Uncharacterized protein n=1 Tax=Sandarakinorhabdus glacialis TaxID=1614636 RepID=A0A917EDL4_9SPHN|nr:hypothetical protein [Polymorphobacter glacialis]GGE21854.1 hypothetical protein GCM10011529_30600 [Polymorphobacter glacialis]
MLLEAEPVPVSAFSIALTGKPSLVTLKHDTEGPTTTVRIVRACGEWVEGDEPEVHADYARGDPERIGCRS